MKTIWLIDIDGTVCEDIPNEESHRFREAKVLPGALEKVQELYDNGDRVTFFMYYRFQQFDLLWVSNYINQNLLLQQLNYYQPA